MYNCSIHNSNKFYDNNYCKNNFKNSYGSNTIIDVNNKLLIT